MASVVNSDHGEVVGGLTVTSDDLVNHPDLSVSRKVVVLVRPLEAVQPQLLSDEVTNVSVDTSVNVHSDASSQDVGNQIVLTRPPVLSELKKKRG